MKAHSTSISFTTRENPRRATFRLCITISYQVKRRSTPRPLSMLFGMMWKEMTQVTRMAQEYEAENRIGDDTRIQSGTTPPDACIHVAAPETP